jgi:DNA-binding transcriptional MerR regulator
MTTAMDIVREVAAQFGVSPDLLRSKQLKHLLFEPRMILCRRLRNERGLSLYQIGQILGGRNHTTILAYLDDKRRQIWLRLDRPMTKSGIFGIRWSPGAKKPWRVVICEVSYGAFKHRENAIKRRAEVLRKLTEAGAHARKIAQQRCRLDSVGASPDHEGVGRQTGVQNGNLP